MLKCISAFHSGTKGTSHRSELIVFKYYYDNINIVELVNTRIQWWSVTWISKLLTVEVAEHNELVLGSCKLEAVQHRDEEEGEEMEGDNSLQEEGEEEEEI